MAGKNIEKGNLDGSKVALAGLLAQIGPELASNLQTRRVSGAVVDTPRLRYVSDDSKEAPVYSPSAEVLRLEEVARRARADAKSKYEASRIAIKQAGEAESTADDMDYEARGAEDVARRRRRRDEPYYRQNRAAKDAERARREAVEARERATELRQKADRLKAAANHAEESALRAERAAKDARAAEEAAFRLEHEADRLEEV